MILTTASSATSAKESDSSIRYRFDHDGSQEIRCAVCATYQDADAAHFAADLSFRYGRSTICRSCASRRVAGQYRTDRAQAAAPSAERYARIVAGSSELAGEEREQVLDDASHRCAPCGSAGRLEFDSVSPLAVGGTHHRSNRQVLCHEHNLSNGNRIIDYCLAIVRRDA